jgi:hypothetical protein
MGGLAVFTKTGTKPPDVVGYQRPPPESCAIEKIFVQKSVLATFGGVFSVRPLVVMVRLAGRGAKSAIREAASP